MTSQIRDFVEAVFLLRGPGDGERVAVIEPEGIAHADPLRAQVSSHLLHRRAAARFHQDFGDRASILRVHVDAADQQRLVDDLRAAQVASMRDVDRARLPGERCQRFAQNPGLRERFGADGHRLPRHRA